MKQIFSEIGIISAALLIQIYELCFQHNVLKNKIYLEEYKYI